MPLLVLLKLALILLAVLGAFALGYDTNADSAGTVPYPAFVALCLAVPASALLLMVV